MKSSTELKTKLIGFGIVFIGLMLCSFSSALIKLYTDYLWFQSMNYTQVFTTRIGTIVSLSIIAAFLAVAILIFNWRLLPHWIAPKDVIHGQIPFRGRFFLGRSRSSSQRVVTYSAGPFKKVFAGAAVILGILFGLSFAPLWQKLLLAAEGVDFGIRDPIFGIDIGFYIFRLPWYEILLQRAQFLIMLTLIGVLGHYLIFGQAKSRAATAHLSILGALWMLLMGAGQLLNRFVLLNSDLGVVFGAGYTDVNARMPLFTAEAVLFLVGAGILIVNALTRKWKLLIFVGASWVILGILGPLYPAAIQRFMVEPNESVVERPYIERNIKYTRYAYGLDTIHEQTYPVTGTVTLADLEENASILQNIRLWDYRPLLRTYGQLQEIRLYYAFNSVDIDRYVIGGQLRQVMLSARELNVDELSEQAQTWVNQHLIFTHGYGVTLSPVNEVTKEGLPQLFVRDIPPVSQAPELHLTDPQIYFGESSKQYILTNTSEQEFDYPQGDSNAYNRYLGPGGIRLGGLIRRILFAIRFSSSQIIFSPALNSESRLHFYRTIQARTQAIAPMLEFDEDAYPVIAVTEATATGEDATSSTTSHVVWLLDAYTWTEHFPYSEPIKLNGVGEINYLRNSIKVSIDAYTGETLFYLIDPNDPIAATYARIFPGLFRPLEEMPQVLRDHWRYPEMLFTVQSQMYATYHMRDPQVFYNREDLWDVPQEKVETALSPMEPYYVTMQLPDSDQAEFMLIRPYVPKQKQNMVAWLYADCDGEDYGQLGIFKLPKDRLVFGPQQIETRVDQDTGISQQLTLWDQRGSRVLRGNLIVIPIDGNFIYIEPLYLEAEAGQLPELKRVIAAYNEKIAMAPTLDEALVQLLSDEASTADIDIDIDPEDTLKSLAQQAWEHYQAAQTCLEQGNWTCYGQEQAALEQILRIMAEEPE